MCGILGYIGKDSIPSTAEFCMNLILLSERGTDATGIAWTHDMKRWRFLKDTSSAKKFVTKSQKRIAQIISSRPQVILAHCRRATHGSPHNVENAHPVWSEKGIIIHNGMVDVLPHKYEGKGQTDTEQMLLDMDSRGWRESLSEISGWLAIAYHNLNRPNELLLARAGAPIDLYRGRSGGFVFVSDKSHLFTRGQMCEAIPMPDNSYRLFKFSDGVFKMYKSYPIERKGTKTCSVKRDYHPTRTLYRGGVWIDDDGWGSEYGYNYYGGYQKSEEDVAIDKLTRGVNNYNSEKKGWEWDGEVYPSWEAVRREAKKRVEASKAKEKEEPKKEESKDRVIPTYTETGATTSTTPLHNSAETGAVCVKVSATVLEGGFRRCIYFFSDGHKMVETLDTTKPDAEPKLYWVYPHEALLTKALSAPKKEVNTP